MREREKINETCKKYGITYDPVRNYRTTKMIKNPNWQGKLDSPELRKGLFLAIWIGFCIALLAVCFTIVVLGQAFNW